MKRYTKEEERAIQEALAGITFEFRKRFLKAKDVSYEYQNKIMFDVVCDIQAKHNVYAGGKFVVGTKRLYEYRLPPKELK